MAQKKKRPTPRIPRWLIFLGVAVAIALAVWLVREKTGKTNRSSSPATSSTSSVLEPDQKVFAQYAGSESCRSCHEEIFKLWEKSNHGLAERPVQSARDRVAFDPPRTLHHGSQSSGFAWTNGSATVTSVGLSGQPETHAVARVIGNDPLRQFLVSFPGGRFQTLEASYDPHTNEWFNVYGHEDRKPGEWGHWTGRGMNWNYMCAGCHNTRLRKNYDPASDSYSTTMAEMSVGCESCHGPLKAHNDWQKQFGKSGRKDPTLTASPRGQILDNCGFCHARRSDLTGDFKPGDPFTEHFDLALVDSSDRYYPDGQVRDEDYEYGSFLGSRMHERGVICTDCHNPHSGKTILSGNFLCLRCHAGGYPNAPIINPVTHSFHKVFGYNAAGVFTNTVASYDPKQIKETGGECINCHMPQTAYMQRHWRHDHGFTIPDPLLTKEFNVPNACNRCHTEKSADWALEFCNKWYGAKMNRPTRERAEWIARAREGDPAARNGLLDMLRRETSPYWQATLTGLLSPWSAQPEISAMLLPNLENTNALVRAATVRAFEDDLADSRIKDALQLRLNDSSRNVRVAAAWTLRASLDTNSSAGRELQLSLDVNADEPLGQLQWGSFFASRNKMESALPHLRKAMEWDPYSPLFGQQLAIALSALNRPREAVDTLREVCRLNPSDSESHYQLGLGYAETGNLEGAKTELERTVQLNPSYSRAWYNLGLAENSLGQPDAAIQALIRAESLEPHDEVIPYARATIYARNGDAKSAASAARRALEINPNYTAAQALLQQLGR